MKEIPFKKSLKINILGTPYTIIHKKESEDVKLREIAGYCDYSSKIIVWREENADEFTLNDLGFVYKRVIRHEIIHAFMYESGIWCNSFNVANWATNEEMTDWFAIQSPKIYKVFDKLNIL